MVEDRYTIHIEVEEFLSTRALERLEDDLAETLGEYSDGEVYDEATGNETRARI